jgi:Holliday junction resolvase-like predicted endonuclease
MSEIKRWSIKQVINGVVYFNQSFTATKEDYLALEKILFLPRECDIVDYNLKLFKKVLLYDNSTYRSFYFENIVTKNDFSINDFRQVLIGRRYNGILVSKVFFYGVFLDFFPPNIIKQGKEFEYHVSDYFKRQGYEVINNFEKEKNDEGIDIIAKKGEEFLLIQCKNWEVPVISHKEIKEFLGNCYLFLYNHKEYRKFKRVRRLYITSQSNLDKSARYLLKDNYPFVEYLQIPFSKEKK